MSSLRNVALFQPKQVGDIRLRHRVVMSPLTRYRANIRHEHGDLGGEYYTQRASAPGTLIISEATLVAAEAGGNDHAPGIWSDQQVAQWKRVSYLRLTTTRSWILTIGWFPDHRCRALERLLHILAAMGPRPPGERIDA